MPRGDSISRYESYDMHSASSPKRRESPLSSSNTKNIRDTVETSKERSDRLAPARVMPGDNRVSQDRLVTIGRAGRFVFLAVCLPPYLVLYGMPKWAAVNLVPKLINAMNGAGSLSAQVGANIRDWFINTLMKPFRDAFGKINFAIQSLTKTLASFFAKLQTAILMPFQMSAKLINRANEQIKNLLRMPATMLEKTRETFSNIMKLAISASGKVVEGLKTPFEKAGEVFSTIGQMISNLAKQVEERASNMVGKISEMSKLAARKIRSSTESVKEKAESVKQFIVSLPSLAIVPAINLFIQTRNVISEWGKFSLRRIRKSEKSIFKKGTEKLKSALDSGKKFLGYFPKKAKETIVNTLKWVRGPLNQYIREEIPFLIDACRFFRWLFYKLTARFKTVRSFMAKTANSVLSKAKIRLVAAIAFFKKYALLSTNSPRKSAKAVGKFFLQKTRSSFGAIKSVCRAFGGLFKELHQEMRSWM